MKIKNEERLGELFIVLQAILWGLFPVLANKSNLPALFMAGSCNVLSILVLAPLAFKKPIRKEQVTFETIINLLITTLVLGFGFTGLVFIANQNSDPVTISILLLAEVPATFFILSLTGHEKLNAKQLLGGLLVVTSAVLVIFKKDFITTTSDILVVLAVFSAPLANHYGKVLRKTLSSAQILTFRNFVGGMLFFICSYFLEPLPNKTEIINALPYLLPNALLVFGLSKILWFEGMFRVSIGKAISLGSIFPVVTMIGTYILIGTEPEFRQIVAIFPGLIGVYLLTRKVA